MADGKLIAMAMAFAALAAASASDVREDRPLKPTDSECGGCESRRAMAEQNGPATGKVEVVCVYYPHWHRYRKGDEWFGADNWKEGEWSFVKTARPRFPGHRQPLVPYTGYLDGANPKDVEKEIALASNAGIDVFLYDYYWYDGSVTQEEAIEKGFLEAPNRDRMKFALMWCYHERNDQFRPKPGDERRRLMSLAHTRDEFLGLIDRCIERYFNRPEYWRKDGKLFFSIYNAPYFFDKRGNDAAQIKSELDEARARVRAAGLGEIHFNAQGGDQRLAELAAKCGFDSLTDYNTNPDNLPRSETDALRSKGALEIDYRASFPTVRSRWQEMSSCRLPYIPNVTTGWDSTPRCRLDEPYPWRNCGYPYMMTFTNSTPDAFREILAEARAVAESDPKKPGAVYINGWNEYTEGTYLLPNNFDADGALRAIATVFGRKPAGEYTYVNPSTKQLLTIPAATYENVPYGPHPKQKIDVFLPTGGRVPTRVAAGDRLNPCPVVIYMHGGGWAGGAMEDHILGYSIRMLLDRGVAVVAVGYRYLDDVAAAWGHAALPGSAAGRGANPPVMGCLDDCEAAVKFVKAHSGEYGIDVSRMALAGGSAGACTALYLALKDGNSLGVGFVAPIIAQTSMDPLEMQKWIPDIAYGGHAFGCRDFGEWLSRRSEFLADIERISPAALARRIDAEKAPVIFLQYETPPAKGGKSSDPTHSPVFGERFKELCRERGIRCEIGYGGRPCFGDVFVKLVDALQSN